MKNDLVVKDNDIISCIYDLTLQQQRILALIISQLPKQVDIDTTRDFLVEFPVKHFADLYDIDLKNAYNIIEQNQDILQKKLVEIPEKDKRIKINLISKAVYIDNKGQIKVEIHRDLLPYLIDLKERFTQYRIKYIYQFSGVNTWRLYELLTQYRQKQQRELSIKEIKLYLNLQGKYKNHSDFMKRVIKPSINEINNYSDLQVYYEILKRGRNVTGYMFYIFEKEEYKENTIDIPNNMDIYSSKDISEMTENEQFEASKKSLIKCGVYEKPAEKISNEIINQGYDYKVYLIEKLDYLIGRYNNLEDKKTSFGGYITSIFYKKLDLKNNIN